MKTALMSFLFLISFASFSQNLTETFKEIKTKSKIDKTDKSALNILNDFYSQTLQANNGELNNETIKKFNDFMGSKNSKNKHLIILFLIYQEHITETAAKGLQPNSELQVDIMNLLENEIKEVYGIIPPIIYIYKSEALASNNKQDQAINTVKEGLKNYPDSIPLKVYEYLNTKDAKLKLDLITNHDKHWLVLQNNIK